MVGASLHPANLCLRAGVCCRLAVPLLRLPLSRRGGALAVLSVVSISSSCVDVQLGQRQGEGHLSSLRVGGTLQDVMQGVPPARPARSDEVCVCGLNIRHRSRIVHTATPSVMTYLLEELGATLCREGGTSLKAAQRARHHIKRPNRTNNTKPKE